MADLGQVVFCRDGRRNLWRDGQHGWRIHGHGAIQPANIFDHHSNPLFGIPANGINYLAGFYQQYGFRTFLASLLVGVYAGTTAGRFLRHVPKNRSAAVGLARELVDASRKAA